MTAATPVLPSDSTLMRRLVETIESQPTGTTVYVVAEPGFPHTVYGFDETVSDVLAAHLARHPTASLYGPFRSSLPLPGAVTLGAPPVQKPGDVWVHYDPSVWEKMGGTNAARANVNAVAIGEERRELVARLLGIDPAEAAHVDTICIGPAAYRKFVVPYLVQVYGIEEAMRRTAE